MKIIVMIMLFLLTVVSLLGVNSALYFDGQDDYLQVNSISTSLFQQNSYTIECWFKGDDITTSTGNQILWGINGPVSNPNTNILMIAIHGNVIKIYDGNNVNSYTGTLVIQPSVWYHIALVKFTDDSFSLYLNGLEELSGSLVTPIASNSTFSLGQEWDANPSDFFQGQIDEFRVWSKVLDQNELRRKSYIELDGDETDLIAYYNLNNSLTDQSVNSHDGTFIGGSNQFLPSSAILGAQSCLAFHGNTGDTRVNCGNIIDPSTLSSFTVECWVEPEISSTNHHRRLITQGPLTWLGINSNRNIYTNFPDNSSIMISTTELTYGIWNHLALVWDGANISLYINGIKDEITQSANSLSSNNADVYLGYEVDFPENHYWGLMDELRIWSIGKSESKIRENMCRNISGCEANLLAYYNFNNTSGLVVQDLSGNSHDGAMTGNYSWLPSSAFNMWLDTSDNIWTEESNWSDGLPGQNANLGIYNWIDELELPNPQNYNNFYIGNGVTISLVSSIDIACSLIIEGSLNLNTYTINLHENANLIDENGILSANSGTIEATMELNNVNQDIAGLGITISESSNLGNTRVIRGHRALGSQAIKRYYQIISQNQPTNASLVFSYLDSELNGHEESQLKLFKSEDGVNWIEQNSSIDTENNTLTLTGVTSFSYWTAAPTGSDQTLPVTLSSFTAVYEEEEAIIKWITQSESNNLGWNIYRGETSDQTQALRLNNMYIPGSGSTTEPTNYTYQDDYPLTDGNEYFYWLEAISLNNESTYHGPINLIISQEEFEESSPEIPHKYGLLSNYPNPFNPSTTIEFMMKESGKYQICVYDVKGRKVTNLFSDYVEAGKLNRLVWDGRDSQGKAVASGIYFYTLSGKGMNLNRKMILVK